MKLVKVTKITESASPDFRSAKWEKFVPGKDNGDVSLPLDYEVKGHLVRPLKVGDTIFMKRTERNGVKCEGIFMSSVITRLAESKKERIFVVETRNSLYLVEEI